MSVLGDQRVRKLERLYKRAECWGYRQCSKCLTASVSKGRVYTNTHDISLGASNWTTGHSN